jgi:phosphatidate cytidylyltransferase
VSSGTGVRVLTAAILIPVVVAAIWWGPNWLVALMTAAVSIIALHEFLSIAAHVNLPSYRLWTYVAAAGIIAQQFYVARQTSVATVGELLDRSPRVDLDLVLFGILIGYAVIALSSASLSEVLPAISVNSAGLIFIVLPLSTVVRLHGVSGIGPKLLLFTVVLVWAGDSAAYFAGRSIGGWKLAPAISPNKTWAGAIANFLGSLFVAAIFGYWNGIPPIHMLAMGAVGSVAGQIGDLFESAWKRSAGVKDSGTILPGHGGMLDRIDALILAAPAVWYYFEWVVMKKY